MHDTPSDHLYSELIRRSAPVNLKTVPTTQGTAVQFTLGFPEGRLVDYRRERSSGIGDSSVQVTDDGMIREFLIRLPPVPNATYTPSQVDSTVARLLGRLDGPDVTYRIVDETRAIWPHIEFRAGIETTPIDIPTFLSWFDSLYDAYRTQYWSEADAI